MSYNAIVKENVTKMFTFHTKVHGAWSPNTSGLSNMMYPYANISIVINEAHINNFNWIKNIYASVTLKRIN